MFDSKIFIGLALTLTSLGPFACQQSDAVVDKPGPPGLPGPAGPQGPQGTPGLPGSPAPGAVYYGETDGGVFVASVNAWLTIAEIDFSTTAFSTPADLSAVGWVAVTNSLALRCAFRFLVDSFSKANAVFGDMAVQVQASQTAAFTMTQRVTLGAGSHRVQVQMSAADNNGMGSGCYVGGAPALSVRAYANVRQ